MLDANGQRADLPSPIICSDWQSLQEHFDGFGYPTFAWDPEFTTLMQNAWIFRGLKRSTYSLQPSIERLDSASSWLALEHKLLEEFRSRARMHLSQSELPPDDSTLGWLALMQHYGVQTRLLDFTFSPYAALYFAVRNPDGNETDHAARVWAIDSQELMARAYKTRWEGHKEQRARDSKNSGERQESRRTGFHRDNRASIADEVRWRSEDSLRMITEALEPRRTLRRVYNERGFVALAAPPIQNRRLSSQQGTFLLNGAESRTFQDSLLTMMSSMDEEWCQIFDIPPEAKIEFEKRLFRMNIHELSLFPDIEGLAGFIRQKARLEMTL